MRFLYHCWSSLKLSNHLLNHVGSKERGHINCEFRQTFRFFSSAGGITLPAASPALRSYHKTLCVRFFLILTPHMTRLDAQKLCFPFLTTDTSDNQVAKYTAGVNQLEWREVESGKLPSQRWGPRAATVDNVLYVTGGYDGVIRLTSILSWDPTNESWQSAGNLLVARSWHAAVSVPSSLIESGCSPTM